MRKYLLFFVSLLFLFSACSPEIVQKLPSEDIVPNSSYLEVTPSESGTGLTLKFNLVPYANYYGYSINSGSISAIKQLEYTEGEYSVDVSTQEVSGDVRIYAKIKNTNPWVQIAEKDFALSLEEIEPKAYISRRSENDVDIKVDSSLDPNSVVYQVFINNETDPAETFFFPDFTVKNIGSAACTIEISQALLGDGKFSKKQLIQVPAYAANSDSMLEFSIEDGFFIAKDIPDGVTTVKFAKYTGSLTDKNDLPEGAVTVESGIARYPISSLKSLESGYFFAYYEEGGSDRISNVEKYTIPLQVKKISVNWQSVDLEIDFEDSVSGGFELQGVLDAKAEKTDTGIKITKLTSNTDYKNLKLVASDYPDYTAYNFDAKTKSFEGVYEWKGDYKTYFGTVSVDHNFKVVVEAAPNGSSTGYYVFFHDEDETIIATGNVGNKLRIMPLIDTAFEPEIQNQVDVDNPGVFKEQNAGYVVNGKKWNSLDMSPSSWNIAKWEPEHDSAVTETRAGMFGGSPIDSYLTTTSFEFKEQSINKSLQPTLLFSNKGGSLVNYGLYKNGKPDQSLGEGDYIFCLKVSE